MKNIKKLLSIVLTLTLLCGLFVVPSLADVEPDETTAVKVIEPVLEEPEEATEQEVVEEEDPDQEEEQEEEAEQDEAADPEEIEEPESEEEYYFPYNHVWEDEKFIYELDAEDPYDPNFRLVLTKTCKSCGMFDFDGLTQAQVLKRYGIDVKEK